MNYFRLKSDIEIRQLAHKIRRKTGIFDSFPVDVDYLLKNITRLLPKFTIVEIADENSRIDLAYVNSDTCTVYARHSLLKQLKANDPEARWVLCHELCHTAAGHSGISAFADGTDHRAKNNPTAQAQEDEAERLTMEILAPRFLVEHYRTANELSEAAGITIQKARTRIKEIEDIERQERGEKRLIHPVIIEKLEAFQKSNKFQLTSINLESAKENWAKAQAKLSGHEEEKCPSCQLYTIQKRGGIKFCDNCGWPSGSDGELS